MTITGNIHLAGNERYHHTIQMKLLFQDVLYLKLWLLLERYLRDTVCRLVIVLIRQTATQAVRIYHISFPNYGPIGQ